MNLDTDTGDSHCVPSGQLRTGKVPTGNSAIRLLDRLLFIVDRTSRRPEDDLQQLEAIYLKNFLKRRLLAKKKKNAA